MTPIILLDDLQQFIEENTADILLECRVRTGPATGKERAGGLDRVFPESKACGQRIRRRRDRHRRDCGQSCYGASLRVGKTSRMKCAPAYRIL